MFCTQCGHQMPENAAFCGICGAPAAPIQRSPAKTAPVPGAPEMGVWNGSIAIDRQRAIDTGKVMKKITSAIICSIIGSAICGFFFSLLLGKLAGNKFEFVIGFALYWGLLEAIPEVIVIIRRAMDPEDTAYVSGAVQDETTNRLFEEKYARFKSAMGTIITVLTTIVFFAALYTNLCRFYPKEMREIKGMLQELGDLLVEELCGLG